MAKGKTAEEIADIIVEKRIKAEQEAYADLRLKCKEAIKTMIRDLSTEVTIPLSNSDMIALIKVTEELRDLNYKFCFIEVQNSSGDIIDHKLRLSIQHAM